jgi:hypothetical protein
MRSGWQCGTEVVLQPSSGHISGVRHIAALVYGFVVFSALHATRRSSLVIPPRDCAIDSDRAKRTTSDSQKALQKEPCRTG